MDEKIKEQFQMFGWNAKLVGRKFCIEKRRSGLEARVTLKKGRKRSVAEGKVYEISSGRIIKSYRKTSSDYFEAYRGFARIIGFCDKLLGIRVGGVLLGE